MISRLTLALIPGFLKEKGLISEGDETRLTITEVTRRNFNLAISVSGKPAFFIKQIQHNLPEVIFSQHREAQCYQIVQQTDTLCSLRALMPRLIFFDPTRSILITELLDGVDVAEANARSEIAEANQLAALVGKTLASLHNSTPLAKHSILWRVLPAGLPWVMEGPLPKESKSQRSDFVAYFEGDKIIAREMAVLRESWQQNTLIHGDARLDNFLFCRPAAASAEPDIRLVDWELADKGESAWDCAGVMQTYWQEWIRTAPPDAKSFNSLRSSIEGFWLGYATNRGMNCGFGEPSFRRAVRLTGIRLMQTAYETYAQSGRWTSTVAHCAQASRILLIETETAIKELRAKSL